MAINRCIRGRCPSYLATLSPAPRFCFVRNGDVQSNLGRKGKGGPRTHFSNTSEEEGEEKKNICTHKRGREREGGRIPLNINRETSFTSFPFKGQRPLPQHHIHKDLLGWTNDNPFFSYLHTYAVA